MNPYSEMVDVASVISPQKGYKVLLLLKSECKRFGVSRLHFNCEAAHQIIFIAYNLQPICNNVQVTKENDTKPFIDGFEALYNWIESLTPSDNIVTNLLKPEKRKW